MGRNAGSDTRCVGNSSGARTITPPSLPELSHGERHVMPAEPETVAERELDVPLCRRIRRVVEITLRIGVRVVDGGWNDAIAYHERAHDELERASGAEHVPGRGFRRAHVHRDRKSTR